MLDLNLLCIDADPKDFELLAMLKEQVTSIFHVTSDSEAYKILGVEPVDAVIIKEDGLGTDPLQVIEMIKVVKKNMLSVIVTSDVNTEKLLKAIRLGVNDVKTGPCTHEEIKGLIKKLYHHSLTHKQLAKKTLMLNQYKNAMDSSLMISKTDRHGVIYYVNDRFWQLSGYLPSEIIGKTHRLFKHPETPKAQMQKLWETIQSKRVFHDVIINRTKDGKPFYTDTFIVPILNERKEIVEYMDMRIDVTPLYTKQRYFQEVLDAQSTMIAVCREEKVTRTNKAFLDFFGYHTNEEFSENHQCLLDLIVEDVGYIDKLGFEAWILSHADVRGVKVCLIDQESFPKVFKAVKNDFENIQGEHEVIISLTDISDIERYSQQLQHEVDEATKALEVQQQRLLQHSRSAALGEMFDNIAHQWRQPIGAINNAIIDAEFTMELEGLDEEKLKQTFAKINEYTNFLSQTIDDFRNFSNPDKITADFSLHDNIRSTIEIIRGAYAMSDIELHYDPPLKLQEATIHGPYGELSQVILNILSNAKDAIKENSISNASVTIALEQADGYYKIHITDNAGGIPDHVMPKLFDPYFTTKHKAQGTGIGLYMSKTIIENHFQGLLEAQNSGGGALFTITLPTAKSE